MSEYKLNEIIDFNPPESIQSGSVAKKVAMEKLTPFCRNISGYEYATYSSGPKFKNGDTLVAKITPCLENGKTAYVDILEEDEIAFGSSEFIVLRAKPEKIGDEFLFYLATSPAFRYRAISCMEGTSGRKRVNEGTLENYLMKIPDIATQRKIVTILSALDRKIQLNKQINRELETIAKELYDYWFMQFDFPDENGKPYRSSGGRMVYNKRLKRHIPVGWDSKSISDISSTQKASITPMKDCLYKYYSLPGFDKYHTYEEEYGLSIMSDKFLVTKNDVLVSKLNPWTSRVIWAPDLEGQICSTEFVVLRQTDAFVRSFLYFTVLSTPFITYCTQYSTGTSHSHRRANPDLMTKYQYPCCESIIKLFGEKVYPMIERYSANLQENLRLTALRDELLPLLMNGQVSVNSTENTADNEIPLEKKDCYDQRFDFWLQNQGLAARGDIDRQTLREIFDVMDDDDK